jgi:hypothetical protein
VAKKISDPVKKSIPKAVTEYIDRIGAIQINFRSYQVKEFKGKYYFEKAYIKINGDGTVTAPEDYMPNEAEAAAIQKAWVEGNIPKSIPARNTKGIHLMNADSKLYLFYDKEDRIIFAQERTEPKAYIPWSFWDDGEWRRMQPDGVIPFFKPRKRNMRDWKQKIMIHEGAKAAEAAQLMKSDHPWYDEFKDYEHWGIVGGALAVNRADYKDLREQMAQDTIYVCDNDHPGRSMLQWISKKYGARLTGIFFDNRFKSGWDIADPLPDEFYNRDKLYIGPRFEHFKKPATYATEIIQPTEKGEKAYTVIRRHFQEEWYNIVSPEAFIHVDYPDRVLIPKEFNNFIAPYSQVPETSRLLVKDDAGKGVAIAYNPGRSPGLYTGPEGGQYINTHKPSTIKPWPKKKLTEADITPFIEFMEHLIPVEHDRHQLLRWCATLIEKPGVKMHYGVLLISETQGVGKGTLGEKILAPLVGIGNTSFPGEEEIVDSKYNYWMAHRRLAVVHEIYAGHSSRAYNKLKSVITDFNIEVHKKYMADYRVENWVHAFACSNSPRALRLSMDDRRWLVPKVREEKRSEGYWESFHNWLNFDFGLAKIKKWAEEFGDYVKTGQDAPWTSIKKEIVEEGFSDGQKLVANVLDAIKSEVNGEHVLISDYDLQDLIRDVVHEGHNSDRLEKPNTIRAIAKDRGWFIGAERVKVSEWKTVIRPIRLIASHKGDLEKDAKEMAKKGTKLFNVKEFYERVGRKM